ncbi:ATP-binding protein [Streptomyces sp. NPDC001339]|uniref:ATP-binding protein n=1 Tax=Streptomyces sp. NPDC001339 TaxID=3364563 RepID=UPI0036AAC35C
MLAVTFTDNGANAVLPLHPRAAAQARKVLGSVISHGDTLIDTAALLLSELVSNAVRHAHGTQLRVAIAHDQVKDVIVVAVFDRNPEMRRGTRCSADGQPDDLETGRGLDLLDALAESWGVATVGDRGKWIWFSLPRRTVAET